MSDDQDDALSKLARVQIPAADDERKRQTLAAVRAAAEKKQQAAPPATSTSWWVHWRRRWLAWTIPAAAAVAVVVAVLGLWLATVLTGMDPDSEREQIAAPGGDAGRNFGAVPGPDGRPVGPPETRLPPVTPFEGEGVRVGYVFDGDSMQLYLFEHGSWMPLGNPTPLSGRSVQLTGALKSELADQSGNALAVRLRWFPGDATEWVAFRVVRGVVSTADDLILALEGIEDLEEARDVLKAAPAIPPQLRRRE